MPITMQRLPHAALIALVAGLVITGARPNLVVAQTSSPVMLPLGYVDTSYSLPAACEAISVGTTPDGGCKTITVGAGQSFQTALNTARRGDIIQLDGSASFIGPFTLPNKLDGPGWVYIISSGYANLPAPGNRIIPNDMSGPCGNSNGLYCGARPNVTMSTDVATIQGGGSPHIAIQTASGADRYRFIGVEIKPAAGQFASSLIRLGGGGETGVEHIIFDRIVSRGDPAVGGRRAFLIQGDSIGVVHSYVSNWWEMGQDSQAITWQDNADVSAVINNYLEAAGENVFADTGTNTVGDQPSDIEIRGNYLRKASNWRANCGARNVKNLFEVKAGHRILVEGNEFADSWADDGNSNRCGQEAAINVKQGNEVSNKHTTHITFRKNRMVRVGNAMKWCMAHCNDTNDSLGHDFAIYNNIFEVDGNVYGVTTAQDGQGFYHWASAGNNLIADHNTIINNGLGVGTPLNLGAGSPGGGRFTNNIIFNLTNFTTSDANDLWPGGYTYTTNLIVGGTCANFPAGNRCPANWAAVGFVNFNGGAGGDYTLSGASPFKGVGSDPFGVGTTDPGANVAAVNTATACAVSGQCGGATGVPPSFGARAVPRSPVQGMYWISPRAVASTPVTAASWTSSPAALTGWALGLAARAEANVAGLYVYAQRVDGTNEAPKFLAALSPADGKSAAVRLLLQMRLRNAVAELGAGTYTVTAFSQVRSGGAPLEVASLTMTVR